MNHKTIALFAGPIAALNVGAVMWLVGFPQPIWWTAGATTLIAVWWIFEPIPIPATSIIPFVIFPLGGVVSSTQVATRYGHYLILLLMGGFLLSTAMEKSGAHRRLALTMVRLVGGASGKRLVLGFMIASAALSMWISNTATVLMLLPIALAVLEKSKDRQVLAVPLLLGVAFAANIGGIGTPVGTPPNVIFMAQYAETFRQEWSFLNWMMIGVPVVVLFTPVCWLWLTRGLQLTEEIFIPDPGKWRTEEVRVLTVFGITALLWVTRSEPFGGWNGIVEWIWNYDRGEGNKPLILDSTVALMMVVVMFLVPNGKGAMLLDWETAVKVPWGLLLLFGGGMAIGLAFEKSGLSAVIGNALGGVTALYIFLMIAVICLVMTFLTEITSNTATTALLMPILAGAANSPENGALLMIPAAISASCAFMLPVATAPNAIVFGTNEISTRTMVQNGFVLNLCGACIITLVCYFLLG